MPETDAVALATSTRDGRPSVRMVLMRHHDENEIGWYTNYASRKGGELAENPTAAILWYCENLARQVRLEGPVFRCTDEESDRYFESRPRGHQIGSVISPQSAVIPGPDQLRNRDKELRRQLGDGPIPRPREWGGFRMRPETVEFWRKEPNRLHSRILFTRIESGWSHCYLAP